jgi:serine-type D-Ala-D-Ala carboxypeptidase/endopeptidase (penicillin-binding protein 4)
MLKNIFFLFFIIPNLDGQSQFKSAINDFVNDNELSNAGISICMMDIATGKQVASYNPYLSLTPASSMKVITTIAGIGILKTSYKFKTEIQHDGSISGGILNGNLYIKGYGDPILGSDQYPGAPSMNQVMDSISVFLKNKGIKKITGKIYGDGTAYESGGANAMWQYDDISTDYGTGSWGLNMRENFIYLTFLQSSVAGVRVPIASVIPDVPNLQFINDVRTGAGSDPVVLGAPYNYTRLVKGKIPTGNRTFTIQTAIPDPIAFAAYNLKKSLEFNSIEVPNSYQNIELELNAINYSRNTLLTLYSPELCDIMSRTNYESVNLYAESILKAIGYSQSGYGSSDYGVKSILNFLKVKGLNINGLHMVDGSGLSPRDACSAYHLAAVLRMTKQDNEIFTDIYNSLPEAGVSGTLKNFMKGLKSPTVTIKAKSGTMTRVKSYTGFINNKKGLYSFSVIVNNFNCTQSQLKPKLERLIYALSKD